MPDHDLDILDYPQMIADRYDDVQAWSCRARLAGSGNSTPKPGAPSPGNDAKATEMSVQSAMLTSTDPRMRA